MYSLDELLAEKARRQGSDSASTRQYSLEELQAEKKRRSSLTPESQAMTSYEDQSTRIQDIEEATPNLEDRTFGGIGYMFNGAIKGAFDTLKGSAMLLHQTDAAEGLDMMKKAVTDPITNVLKSNYSKVDNRPAEFVGSLLPAAPVNSLKAAAAVGASYSAGQGKPDQPYLETLYEGSKGAAIPAAIGAYKGIMKGANALNTRFISANTDDAEAAVSNLLSSRTSGTPVRELQDKVPGMLKQEGSRNSEAVDKIYKKIKDTPINVNSSLDQLVGDKQYGEIYKKALDEVTSLKKIAPNQERLLNAKTGSLMELDAIRRQLSNTIDKLGNPANAKYDKELAAMYTGAKQKITGIMDTAAPEFATFRQLAGDDIASISELRSTIVGKLSNLKSNANEGDIAKIFNVNKLEETMQWRDLIQSQDPELWKKLTQSYITNRVNSLGKANDNARPLDIVEGLMQTPNDRKFLQELFKGDQIAQARFETISVLTNKKNSLVDDILDVFPQFSKEGAKKNKALENNITKFLSGRYDDALQASIQKNGGVPTLVAKDMAKLLGKQEPASKGTAKGTAILGAALAGDDNEQ